MYLLLLLSMWKLWGVLVLVMYLALEGDGGTTAAYAAYAALMVGLVSALIILQMNATSA